MYLTTLVCLTTTPAAVLMRWMQDEAVKDAEKAEHVTNLDRDPHQVQRRIEAAIRDGVEPQAADLVQTDWRGQFIVSCLEAVREHQDAARRGAGDPSAHVDCVAAWRLAAKAAQVGRTFPEVTQLVAIASQRSAELVKKARRQRKAD